MPRLVDYGARFAFLREAPFEVILASGVDALSRQSVAQALGVSDSTIRRLVAADADLVVCAAEEVATRRARRRWHAVTGTPRERAIVLLRRLTPDTDDRVAEEVVWWRMVLSARVRSGADRLPPSPEGPLRQRYLVALRGFGDPSRSDAEVEGRVFSAELTGLIEARAAQVATTLAAVIDVLEVPDTAREGKLEDLHLLIDGITIAVCTGRLAPADAMQALERAVVTAA